MFSDEEKEKKTVRIMVTGRDSLSPLIEDVRLLEWRENGHKALVIWRGACCEILSNRIVPPKRNQN